MLSLSVVRMAPRRCLHIQEPTPLTGRSKLGCSLGCLICGSCKDNAALLPSIVPTRHFQNSLPRLPIPSLSHTLSAYLSIVQPLVPPAQYAKTVQLALEFEKGDGKKGQAELLLMDRANQHTSYTSADWFQRALRQRDPLPLHSSSPLPVCMDAGKQDMLVRATYWITSSVLFYKRYMDNQLRPAMRYASLNGYWGTEWFKRTVALVPDCLSTPFASVISLHRAVPLDMSMYDTLFSACRVPGVLQDEIKAVCFSSHIIVQHHGQQFVVHVASDDGTPLPKAQIYARLKAIVDLQLSPNELDVSVLTSMPRTEWSAARTQLLRQAVNLQCMKELESAMFVLSLDDDLTSEYTCLDGVACYLQQQLARDSNRWWDKSLTVSVSRNGSLSVIYQPTCADAHTAFRYVEEVYNHSVMQSSDELQLGIAPSAEIRPLQWRLSPELKEVVHRARMTMLTNIKKLDVHCAVVHGLGADISLWQDRHGGPFAFFQLALQLAWWRLNRSTVATVASLNTAKYKCGRSSNVMLTSQCTQKFALAVDGKSSIYEKQHLCRSALHAVQRCSPTNVDDNCALAHLATLQSVLQRMYSRTPLFFVDNSYQLLESPVLCTCSDGAPALFGGVALPCRAGYGVGHTALEDALALNLCAWKGADGPRHTAKEFGDAVCQAATDLYQLLRHDGGTV